MILPVVLLKSSNWVSRIRNRNFSEKKYLVRYLSLLTFSSSRGGGEGCIRLPSHALLSLL